MSSVTTEAIARIQFAVWLTKIRQLWLIVNQTTKVDNKSGSSGYISQGCDVTQKGEKVTVSDERDSGKFLNYFMNHINELTAESDELGDPRIRLHAPRYTSNETQV